MITGFNTDIQYDGKTYHVQTEDKGLETPFILTLVYDGGTILASKRQPYEDLFTGGFSEKDLAARLNRQHNLVCAAIDAGRIEDLIALTSGKKPKRKKRSDAKIPRPGDEEIAAPPIPKPEIQMPAVVRAPEPEPEPVIEAVEVVDETIPVPDEAIQIVSDMAGHERPAHNKLCLEFVNETVFRGGEGKSVTFMLSRGTERKVVGNAKILVKILGANIRPQIFHSVTDKNGLAKMELDLPEFAGGRAAILIRAAADGDEIELRRPIVQS